MTQKTRRKAATHPFVRDTELPPDANGHYVCRCGVVGTPGDARHHLPDVPEQAEHVRRYEHEED